MTNDKYDQLSDDELVARYHDSGIAHGDATDQGEPEKGNIFADAMISISKEIAARKTREEIYAKLLLDKQDHVRVWAASHALEVLPSLAVSTLEEIEKGGGSNGFSAKYTLKGWRQKHNLSQ